MSTVTDNNLEIEPPLYEGSPEKPGRPRHNWLTRVLTADPDNPGHFWIVQEVEGSWVETDDYDVSGRVMWEKKYEDDPTITRIAYMTMDQQGNLKNAHDRSRPQGR